MKTEQNVQRRHQAHIFKSWAEERCIRQEEENAKFSETLVTCRYMECNKEFPLKFVKYMARHERSCIYRTNPCEYCQQPIVVKYLEDHIIGCPKRLIKCTYCGVQVLLQDQNEHESISIYGRWLSSDAGAENPVCDCCHCVSLLMEIFEPSRGS